MSRQSFVHSGKSADFLHYIYPFAGTFNRCILLWEEFMKKLIQSAWALVRENKRAYIVVNVVYYGLVVIFMIVAAFNRPLQDMLLETVGAAFMTGPLAAVGNAYVNAEVLKATGLTFLVNLVIGSLLYITLPSLIIPFLGFLLGTYRAMLWGLLFYPGHPDIGMIMLPHSITLILEGQAYILALFAVYLQGRAFLWPKSVGLETHGQGYVEGLKRTGRMYILVILTLAIAAVYEVLEVILIAKLIA
jgi:hypothetical protein